jgi:hypothetical protein
MIQFVTQHQVSIVFVFVLLLLACACAGRFTAHPGALNTTDSAAYDALLIAETTIDQVRTYIEDGELPPDSKELFNALVQAYTVARESWLTYRGAITANVPAQMYFDNLTKNLSNLASAIQAVRRTR